MDTALLERFIAKVEVQSPGCWIWTGAKTAKGYGHIKVDGAVKGAHRVAWTLLVGGIPAGHEMDHLCRVPSCVNPDHLEPVSNRINIARSSAGTLSKAFFSKITRCAHGHEYTEENTEIRPNGTRACCACRKARDRARPKRVLTAEQKARRAELERARRTRRKAELR